MNPHCDCDRCLREALGIRLELHPLHSYLSHPIHAAQYRAGVLVWRQTNLKLVREVLRYPKLEHVPAHAEVADLNPPDPERAKYLAIKDRQAPVPVLDLLLAVIMADTPEDERRGEFVTRLAFLGFVLVMVVVYAIVAD